ncbi:MAG: tetratricopeptide repeat protein [Candidatus Marinimicrobia bacterium]|nr:tetratricopeptide repeat protein [Candidatus Neomarinimicrobiota bacterium]
MSESQSSFSRFFQELRNRRVFRVAAVYLGVGYAILEAASIIIPTLNLPAVIVKIVLGLVVAGFPIAVLLAWMFQMTSEGLRRSPKSGEKQSQTEKPLTGNATIIVLLAIIAGLLAYPRFTDTTSAGEEPSSLVDSKSIAVLPFTPFTKTDDDQSFADGMHDDILTQLSKVADLKVISRTSVMQYKETTMLISDIAKELGVANVLEGSVRRAGDQIRIVAQLINAETDEHIWAETFDRKYTDIFSIQSEVAQKIARALKAKLTPKEKHYIETKPTENQEAWQLYLRGQLLNTADVVNKDSVAAIFDEATQLDPEFLLPYTRLTRIHAHMYFDGSGTDPSPERLKKARKALDKANTINPNAPETHLAQGYYYYYGSRDYELALMEFSTALEMQPNNSDLYAAIAYVERRLGKYDTAMENMEKAVALDPNNAAKVDETTSWAFQMRRWDLAYRYWEQLSAIHSGKDASVERMVYYFEIVRSADLNKLQGIHDQLLQKFTPDELRSVRIRHATYTGDFKKALEIERENSTSSFLDIGILLKWTGNLDSAQTFFDSTRIEAEQAIQENPEDWQAYGDLGTALALLGRYEEALEWGKKGVELMPLSRDGLLGVSALQNLVDIHLFSGNLDDVIDLTKDILELPGWFNVSLLKLDPDFSVLREHPRFQELLDKHSGQSD